MAVTLVTELQDLMFSSQIPDNFFAPPVSPVGAAEQRLFWGNRTYWAHRKSIAAVVAEYGSAMLID